MLCFAGSLHFLVALFRLRPRQVKLLCQRVQTALLLNPLLRLVRVKQHRADFVHAMSFGREPNLPPLQLTAVRQRIGQIGRA